MRLWQRGAYWELARFEAFVSRMSRIAPTDESEGQRSVYHVS